MTREQIDKMKSNMKGLHVQWKAACQRSDAIRHEYLDLMMEINEAERQLLLEQHEMFDPVEKGC